MTTKTILHICTSTLHLHCCEAQAFGSFWSGEHYNLLSGGVPLILVVNLSFELVAEAQRDLTPEDAARQLRETSEIHYLEA